MSLELLAPLSALSERPEALERGFGALNAAIHAEIRDWSGKINEKLLEDSVAVFEHWLAALERPGEAKSRAPVNFWLKWVELGCAIGVMAAVVAPVLPEEAKTRCQGVAKALEDAARDSRAPVGFPNANLHCNKELQVAFSVDLWDAAVLRPMLSLRKGGASEKAASNAITTSLRVFAAWMSRAMLGYEVVYIATVEQALCSHIRESMAVLRAPSAILVDLISAEDFTPATLAVVSLAASALCLPERDEASRLELALERRRAHVVKQLMQSPLPHVQEPLAVLTTGYGVAAWNASSDIVPPSWTSVVVQTFAAIRVAMLPLLSPNIAVDGARLESVTLRLQHSLSTLVLSSDQTTEDVVDLIYRLIEQAVSETTAFFHSTRAHHIVLLSALQSSMPSELFRPVLSTYVSREKGNQAPDFPAQKVLSMMAHLYDAASTVSVELSKVNTITGRTKHPFERLVRSFSLLTRFEFVREALKSPERNERMSIMTEHIEQAIESAPDAVFHSIFQSLHATTASLDELWSTPNQDTSIPDEMNIVRACQVLAVGLLIQKKLRALLLQSSNPQLRDDAVAVVFLGVNSAYEPLDTFAHRFLGVCLTHLGQFISVYSIAPYYIQLALAGFPTNVTQQTVAAVCGTVFGALFYSGAANNGKDARTAATRMILWAMKQFISCSQKLLLVEPENAEVTTPGKVVKANSDGMYLVGLMAEITKMSPLDVISAAAMALERLVSECQRHDQQHGGNVCAQVKQTIFTSFSQLVELEKRAWLAAWYIELENQYPDATSSSAVVSRL